jgi:anti-sigma B factor antagonist
MMETKQESRQDWLVVSVRGRADSETADRLEQELRAAVEQHKKVAVDIRGVDYISSAGLRALIQAARAAQGRSELAVCAPSASVQRVFDMSGLQNLVHIQGELPC